MDVITEYDRFSEEDTPSKSADLPDALKAEQDLLISNLDDAFHSNPDDFAAVQMDSETKALHQITVGEPGDGIDTNLAANVGFEDLVRINEGTDLEANNNVDP